MSESAKRILIIDPDQHSRDKFLALFENEDYDLETSPGITRAVEKIKNVKFDCIIVDVDLPEMKGYEAVKIIKSLDPKVQVIITTRENTIETEYQVRQQDIFYYYIKSFDSQELKSAVRNVFIKLGKRKEVKKMKQQSKILIVDDDRDYVHSLRIILENKNYKVETAHNQSEAMEKIGTFEPDLILLDIMMERLDDGFTICYRLKHDDKLKHIPVFAISSITEKTGFKFSPKTDGEYFEADDYAEKPIDPKQLIERIEKLLS